MAGQFCSTVQSDWPDAALFAQVFGAQSFNPIQPLPRGRALIQSVTEALIAAAE